MKTKFILLGLFLSTPSLLRADNHLLDKVVAVVNSEAITESELDSVLYPLYEEYRKEYEGQKLAEVLTDARRKLLSQLIEDHLVFQEAKARGIQIDEVEIDHELDEFKTRFPKGRDFEETLKRQGLNLKDFRERLRRQAMIRRLQDMEIRAKIVVSPTEVEEYYKVHPDEFSEQERLKVRSMTVKKNDEANEKGLMDEAAMGRIQELRKKVLAGGNFSELAKKNSEDVRAKDGGASDWIKRGDMIPEINDVLFQTAAGGVTEIIETPMGYHFFQVDERKEGAKHSLEEVRNQIFETLYRKKFQARFDEWMNELKRNAYISVR